MNNNKMTYGQLYEKLKVLGFRQQPVELDDKRGYLFEHESIRNALIVLPQRHHDELVEPFYMNSVLANLKAHDLLPETNPLLNIR